MDKMNKDPGSAEAMRGLSEIAKNMDPQMREQLFKSMMSRKGGGGDTINSIYNFILMGDPGMLEGMLTQTVMLKHGSDFMQFAIKEKKPEILKVLLKHGGDILKPPVRLNHDEEYRQTPYIIQAISSGNLESLKIVIDGGASITSQGFICYSTKKKNHVTANVIGACAWFNQPEMINFILKRVDPKNFLETKVIEKLENEQDLPKNAPRNQSFVKEFAGFTPLMLAVARGEQNFKCFKELLTKGCDINKKDDNNNNLLQIAAIHGNNIVLDYLAKNTSLDFYHRNNQGYTALFICQQTKNQEGIKILNELIEGQGDHTQNIAEKLMKELEMEEKQQEMKKEKNKNKKWKNKINKIAKAENITPEEVERRLEQEEELKRQEEIRQQKLAEEKERQREEEIARQQRILREQREEQERLEAEEEERLRQELLEEERRAKQERQRAQEEKRARYRSEARKKNERENAQGSRRENKSRQRYHDEEQEDNRPSLRKEKTPARKQDNEEQRQGRHQTNAQTERIQRAASKSQRREEATDNLLIQESEQNAKQGVYGLGGEMALKATMSKKAQQRLRKKMTKEEEEQKAHEESLKQAAVRKEEEKKRLEEEKKKAEIEERKEKQRQKDKERAEKKRAEKEAKELEAATKASIEHKKKEDKKREKEEKEVLKEIEKSEKALAKQKEKEHKKGAKKEANESTQPMEYRAKTPAGKPQEAAHQKEEEKIEQVMETPKGDEQPKPPAKQAKPRRERGQKAAKKEEEQTPAQVEEKQEAAPVNPAPEKVEHHQESKKSQKHEKHEKESKHAKTENKEVHNESINKEIISLQSLLLAKENEIGKLQNHLDKQEKKNNETVKENLQLKEQLRMSSDKNQLKNQIAQLNEQLNKQQKLNKLQAYQILEFEQSLWQETKQREEAEERLNEVQSGRSAPNPGAESTEQDLRVKQVQIRQLQNLVEQYKGNATVINGLGRTELVDLSEDLEQSLEKIKIAMNNQINKK